MAEPDLNWDEAEERLKKLIKRYERLPAKNGWFSLRELRKAEQRFLNGERTADLYQEIMSYKL